MSTRTELIYANARQFSNFISMEVIRPDTIQPEFRRAMDMEQAQKIIDDLNRDYMVTKLVGWLRQRRKASERREQTSMAQVAAQIEVELNKYQKHSMLVVGMLIRRYSAALESLAPSPAANHYQYYTDTILRIINACRGE